MPIFWVQVINHGVVGRVNTRCLRAPCELCASRTCSLNCWRTGQYYRVLCFLVGPALVPKGSSMIIILYSSFNLSLSAFLFVMAAYFPCFHPQVWSPYSHSHIIITGKRVDKLHLLSISRVVLNMSPKVILQSLANLFNNSVLLRRANHPYQLPDRSKVNLDTSRLRKLQRIILKPIRR